MHSQGIAVLKGGDAYLPEVVTIAEAMKATRRSIRWLHFGGIVATRMHDTDSWLQHCAWKRELERDSLLKFDFTRPWREKADWELLGRICYNKTQRYILHRSAN